MEVDVTENFVLMHLMHSH